MKESPNIRIFVAHHKPGYIYEDDVYIPIQVGKKNTKVDLGILGDDTGDNISEKNSNYAELTAMYWVWKNYDLKDVDYIGLCHYRRYLAYKFRYNPFKIWNNYDKNHAWYTKVIQAIKYFFGIDISKNAEKKIIQYSSQSLKKFLRIFDYDICTGKRMPTKPLHKLGLCNEELWCILYEIIIEKYPDYEETIEKFDGLFLRSGCNLGILKKEIFLEYSNWLFGILFQFEEKIKEQNMIKICLDEPMTYGTRFMGCLGERLFNLFVYHKKLHGAKISHKFSTIGFRDL